MQVVHWVLIVLAIHFVADFILQSDWMAMNKSKRNGPLLCHIMVYTACLLPLGWIYAGINGVAHLITDYVTSRVTSYLWGKDERHWFFVVIGLDQLIHQTVLVLTLPLIWWLR